MSSSFSFSVFRFVSAGECVTVDRQGLKQECLSQDVSDCHRERGVIANCLGAETDWFVSDL